MTAEKRLLWMSGVTAPKRLDVDGPHSAGLRHAPEPHDPIDLIWYHMVPW